MGWLLLGILVGGVLGTALGAALVELLPVHDIVPAMLVGGLSSLCGIALFGSLGVAMANQRA